MRGIFLRGFILLPIIVLQGCALPVPVQVASWVIDGISCLATEKSVADHGVSLVAQKDCAMWRGFKGEAFCREDTASIYALWDLGEPENTGGLADGSAPAAKESEGAPGDLAAFETAAGAMPLTPEPASDASSAAPSGSLEARAPEPNTVPPTMPEAAPAVPETPLAAAPEPVTPEPVFSLARFFETFVPRSEPPVPAPSAGGDMYYVIGSFRRIMEAERLADRHFTLEPAVIVANQGGRQAIRVVVGPVIPSDENSLRRAIAGNGISDAWAMRFDPTEWELSPLRARDVAELP